MKNQILASLLMCIFFSSVEAEIYKYADYKKLRSEFDAVSTLINKDIELANEGYIRSLNSYQECSSNTWRVVFTTVIPEIDTRRFALDTYKRETYVRAGKQNYEMYKIATEHKINNVQADTDISEFVIWYKNHISFMKGGPFHELQVYVEGYEGLTSIYEKMADSCKNNSIEAATNYDLVSSGIKGLLDGVLSLIRK